VAKPVGRPVGAVLLPEGERRVEHDDHGDRGRQRRHARQQREHHGHPQQQGEQVGQLAHELAQEAAALALGHQVRAVTSEPLTRLERGEAPRYDGDTRRPLVHRDAPSTGRLDPAVPA
jgi:hypothetical protein